MPASELHVFADGRETQNSVPEHSIQALPHSPLVQAGGDIQEYQDDEPPDRGEAEVRFDQLSSRHVRQNHGHKSIYGGEDSVVDDRRVKDLTETDTRRKKNDEYIH